MTRARKNVGIVYHMICILGSDPVRTLEEEVLLQLQTVPREWLWWWPWLVPLPLLRLLGLGGVCRLEKLELWRHRPMPLVTRDSSMV